MAECEHHEHEAPEPKRPVHLDSKFRSRKWQLSAGTQIFSTIALVCGWLDGSNYSAITQANIVAYSFANAAEYFTDRERDKP